MVPCNTRRVGLSELKNRLARSRRRIFRVFINAIGNTLRDSSSKIVAKFVLCLSKPFRQFHLIRRWVDEAQISDPLSGSDSLPEIDLVIAAATKDLRSAKLAVTEFLKHASNPTRSVLIVVSNDGLNLAKQLFATEKVQIQDEREFLPRSLLAMIEENHPAGRKGWITQQVIGIFAAMQSDAPGIVVLDSDTVLIRPLAFLDRQGVQLLQFSHEYVAQYEKHAARVWGARRRHANMSYVTHYQLMQPDIVREMFPTPEDIGFWLLEGDMTLKSPIADYHSYGRFLVENHPSRFMLGRWGNKSAQWGQFPGEKTDTFLFELREKYSTSFSVSFHTYLD